jgi:hypothetical protein
MPKHEDMDFPHAPIHCDDCWEQEIQVRQLAEQRRGNDLKERELYLREQGEWVEQRPRPRPTYVLPPPPQQPQRRGGMSVEPRE